MLFVNLRLKISKDCVGCLRRGSASKRLNIIAVGWLGGAIAPFLLATQPAVAQTTGMQGSYIGVTVAPDRADEVLQTLLEMGNQPAGMVNETLSGASQSNRGLTGKTEATQLQGRLDLPNTPLSVRGAVYVREDVRAVLPMLSYDLPVSNNANVYAGAGYAFVRTPGEATPVGDRNGVVLTTGAEAAMGSNIVVYGDARMGLNAENGSTPVRLQVGIGHRF